VQGFLQPVAVQQYLPQTMMPQIPGVPPHPQFNNPGVPGGFVTITQQQFQPFPSFLGQQTVIASTTTTTTVTSQPMPQRQNNGLSDQEINQRISDVKKLCKLTEDFEKMESELGPEQYNELLSQFASTMPPGFSEWVVESSRKLAAKLDMPAKPNPSTACPHDPTVSSKKRKRNGNDGDRKTSKCVKREDKKQGKGL